MGIDQIVVGDYPRPIDESIATLKAGGRIEPRTVPKSGFNSLVALIAGGPVGFEAAITGVLGGTATWAGRCTSSVGALMSDAWGTEQLAGVPRVVHQLPYWLAALAGLFYRRSPILFGIAGGVVFALMAVPDQLVLFSGQEGIQLLPDASNGALAYITIAKWLALVVAFLAGWRGGPVFPTYTAIAAFAVLAANLLGAPPEVYMVAAIAAVSIVFVKGSVPLAFILTLYPVPLSYTAVILISCVGGAVALALARSVGVLPVEPEPDFSAASAA